MRVVQTQVGCPSGQITPRVLTEALAAGGNEAKRTFDAMKGMRKIDLAAIEASRHLQFAQRPVRSLTT